MLSRHHGLVSVPHQMQGKFLYTTTRRAPARFLGMQTPVCGSHLLRTAQAMRRCKKLLEAGSGDLKLDARRAVIDVIGRVNGAAVYQLTDKQLGKIVRTAELHSLVHETQMLTCDLEWEMERPRPNFGLMLAYVERSCEQVERLFENLVVRNDDLNVRYDAMGVISWWFDLVRTHVGDLTLLQLDTDAA